MDEILLRMDSELAKLLSRERTGLRGECLEPENLARCCPMDFVHMSYFDSHEAHTSMGQLDILPLELRNEVLLSLDLETLTTLRRTSQSSRLAVEHLPKYKALRAYAPELLRAAISIGISDMITVYDLYEFQATPACCFCGDFAAYIYLLTSARVCWLCLMERVEILPMLPSHARDEFGLDNQTFVQVPTFRSLPGTYSHRRTTHRKRFALVDRVAAERAGAKLHGSVDNMHKVAANRRGRATLDWREKMNAYEANPTMRKPRRPPNLSVFDGQGSNPYRFMSVIRVPWLNRSNAQWRMVGRA